MLLQSDDINVASEIIYSRERHLIAVFATVLTSGVNSSDYPWLHVSALTVIFRPFGITEM